MIVEVSKRNRVFLEQLRQMDGEPIWVEVIVENCIEDGYVLVSVYDESKDLKTQECLKNISEKNL